MRCAAQIDIEMSFVAADDIRALIEHLLQHILQQALGGCSALSSPLPSVR